MQTIEGFDFFPLVFDKNGKLASQDAFDASVARAGAVPATDAVFIARLPERRRWGNANIASGPKSFDAGAIAGDSMRDASRRSDGRGSPIRLVDTSRPAARDPGPAPSAGRIRPFESTVSRS